MEMRPSFQIPALIKSLTDVVLPAVDPANKLAQEQGQLVVAMLHLIAQRLPLQYRYDRFELDSFLQLADTLSADGAGIPEAADALQALAVSASEGRALLARAGAEPGELESANLRLRERVGAVVTAASATGQAARLKAVNHAVLAHAQSLLLRERSWLALQGWEGPNAGLPDAASLIGG